MAEDQQLNPILEDFLQNNGIKPGWRTLISSDRFLPEYLQAALNFQPINHNYRNIVPGLNQYLRAFSFAEPGDIKVVIIGTSPAVAPGVANGLAFSTDNYPTESQAVNNFNQAANQANIENSTNHELWAMNGVLLLNAALTMSDDREDPEMINHHNDRWFIFMRRLLTLWISQSDYPKEKPLFVITLGHADRYRNFAKSLWNGVHAPRTHITELEAHHPTFPREENNFIQRMQDHFHTILNTYPGIFN